MIGLGHDQSPVGVAKNAFLLQRIGAPADGFDRHRQEAGERGARDALIDCVGLDGLDAAEAAIEVGVLHDGDHVGVQDGVDDQQVDEIEVVKTDHLAHRAQHIGQRMAGDASNPIRGVFVVFTFACH